MKEIKLTGREIAVIKAIDQTTGTSGAEILERAQLEEADILDLLNGLTDVGYVEAYPPGSELAQDKPVTKDKLSTTRFEVNPSYSLQLKEAMRR